ncbi:MAG: MotA/TolQ/ExbB proton channel family protein, partial [Calditrichaeota bacterium]|nr:MotA/TolQ/ExbB proton channel family protein [Calditrichota bacterium]
LGRAALAAVVLALFYASMSFAQTGTTGRYVTMSERIGIFIVLFRAFDVWIYFFQVVLLFLGIGLTLYYLIRFHQKSFLSGMRQALAELTATGNLDPRQAIDFEIESLQNRFLFLDMMIAAAPASGLLGTVVGLVQVFREQTLVEHVTMQSLASGMYVAMVTTVCGLVVAILGMIGRHFLLARVADMREILAGPEGE